MELALVVSIVVAATSLREVNSEVFKQARLRNVLCNAVDDPENCDFYYPAVVNRGDLQIAISTGGRSPALAQRLSRAGLDRAREYTWERTAHRTADLYRTLVDEDRGHAAPPAARR